MKKHVLILTVLLVAVVMLLGLSGVMARAGGLVEIPFNPLINFTAPSDITNPYWPLTPDTTFKYWTVSKDGCEINYVWVKYLASPVMIAGLDTQEVQDWVYADENCNGVVDNGDYVSENTLDWYVQDDAGNAWYVGEHTEEYSGPPPACPPDAGCTDTEGTWNANIPGAEPGIIMLANPTPGDFYQQEYLEDEAEDLAKVLQVNARVNLTFDNTFDGDHQQYDDCLKTKEWSPLEIGVIEHKYYCDGLLLLVNELHGGTVRTELVDYWSDTPQSNGVIPPGFVFDTTPTP